MTTLTVRVRLPDNLARRLDLREGDTLDVDAEGDVLGVDLDARRGNAIWEAEPGDNIG